MMLVDSHAHLDAPEFRDDLEEVLERAKKEKVEAILAIGCLSKKIEDAVRLLELVESKTWLYAAFGVHPHDASLFNDEIQETLVNLMTHPKVIGLGEIGLDYYYTRSPEAVQKNVFCQQLRLARSIRKPVIIHTRDAEEETLDILEQEFPQATDGVGVMHCFTGSSKLAERTLLLGFYLSFGGILTFKNAVDLRKTAAEVTEDRILLETDSPYLAPVPKRGQRNEPSYVRLVAEQMALLKGKKTEEIIQLTGENFRRLFRLQEVNVQ